MNPTLKIVIDVVAIVVAGGGVLALLFYWLRNSENRPLLVLKWAITAGVIAVIKWKVFPIADQGGMAAFSAVAYCMLLGLVMFATWRRSIGSIIADPLGSLFDGGNVPVEPKPLYSIARSLQKRGKYLESVAELRRQLDAFPTDMEGLLLLAQIQAEDLKDLPGAELTIHHFCSQPGHAPKNIAFALYSMADWHLKIGQDSEAARRNLQMVIDMFPDSEVALAAAQRIAHLGGPDILLAPHDRRKFVVAEGVQNVGLLKASDQPQREEESAADTAVKYVEHLQTHPLDTEAREKLAIIYADYYGRLDMATDQLEQLITMPNQPQRLVVHWLNLLADIQVRCGAGFDTVQNTLQAIVDRYPTFAAADQARKRLALLKLEIKAREKSEDVKLGTYEQNIGLKQRRAPAAPS
jgi:tetratricopeptide (TPR) repeat protein